MNSNVSYFYLRHLKYSGGSHRFACIALSKADSEHYRVSFYLHKVTDGRFKPHVARSAAVGRLNSENRSMILHKDKLSGWGYALMEELGITNIIQRDLRKYMIETFDVDRMQSAMRGGISQLEPVKQSA